jgi:hypothetical protein
MSAALSLQKKEKKMNHPDQDQYFVDKLDDLIVALGDLLLDVLLLSVKRLHANNQVLMEMPDSIEHDSMPF